MDLSTEMQYNNSLIFYGLLTTTVLLYALHWWQQQSRMARLANLLPGPTTLPFIGNALITVGKTPHGIHFIIHTFQSVLRTPSPINSHKHCIISFDSVFFGWIFI